MLPLIESFFKLLEILFKLHYERTYLLPLLSVIILPIILILITTRNIRKVFRILEPIKKRKILVFILYPLNILAKIIVLLLIILLILKPYLLSVKTIIIEEEMEGKYMDKSTLIVILIDCSHSMELPFNGSTRLETAKKLAENIVEHLSKNDTIVVAFFADTVVYSTPLNASKEKIINLVKEFNKTEDYTSIGNALTYALTLGTALEKPTAVILISDGGNNGGVNPLKVAEKALKAKTPILTVYIGKRLYSNPVLLYEIAKKSNGTFFEATSDIDYKVFPRIIARKAKYMTLKRHIRLEEKVPVKDYETPFKLITESLILFTLIMFLTGV